MSLLKQKSDTIRGSNDTLNLLKANLCVSIIVFLTTTFLMQLTRVIAVQFIKMAAQFLEMHFMPARKRSGSLIEPGNSRETLALKSESPPLTIGVKRLHFQYSAVLPQTYLTLVSVLQGVAFSVLLLKIPFPEGDSWSTLTQFLLQQYLYLPYIISSLIILVIWSQFVHVCLFLTWPFSVRQSTLIFLLSVVEVLAFDKVARVSVWLICIGLTGIIGGIIRLNNLKFLTERDVDWERSAQKAASIYKKSQKRDGVLYIFSGSIVLAFGLTYNQLIKEVESLAPLLVHYIFWSMLVILLCEMCIILLMDMRFRQSFLLQLTENSDLVVSSHGIVRYRE